MNIIKSILTTIVAVTVLASCEIETSANGDLDGFWHLVHVDTLSTGGTCDMSGRRVFWSVQVSLLNVIDYDKQYKGYLLHFDNTESTLHVFDPYEDNRAEGDIKVEDISILSPLGINSLDETFTIESLNSNRMTLVTDELKLNFKKM